MRAKLVYEKFEEISDPIHDMGIGVDAMLKKYDWLVLSNYLNGMTQKDKDVVMRGMKINSEHTMYLGEKNSNDNIAPHVKYYLQNIKNLLKNKKPIYEETYSEWIPDNRQEIETRIRVYETKIGKIGEFAYLTHFPGLVQYFGDPQAFFELKPFEIIGTH